MFSLLQGHLPGGSTVAIIAIGILAAFIRGALKTKPKDGIFKLAFLWLAMKEANRNDRRIEFDGFVYESQSRKKPRR